MPYTLNLTAQLLDPTTLTYNIHEKGAVFTPYWPVLPSPPPGHPLHGIVENNVLLVLSYPPHTRALVTQESLNRNFTRIEI